MNININSIAFRNFLSYGSRWQKVDFISGINLILGIDKGKDRSNGAGKCVSGNTLIDISFDNPEIEELLKNI